MSQEPTLQNVLDTVQDVLEAVQGLSSHMDQKFEQVDRRFENNDKRFDGIDQRFDGIDQRLDKMDKRFDSMDQRLDKVEFQISDIRDTMAAKMATKDDLAQVKSEMITEIDRFVVAHQTLDIELVSLRSRCQRMETFMFQVATKLNLKFEPS